MSVQIYDPQFLTTSTLADELGTTIGRVQYIIMRDRIKPDLVAGRTRVYRADRLGEFRVALKLGAEAVTD